MGIPICIPISGQPGDTPKNLTRLHNFSLFVASQTVNSHISSIFGGGEHHASISSTPESCPQAVELLRAVAAVDPRDYEAQMARTASGVRNVGSFIGDLAERCAPAPRHYTQNLKTCKKYVYTIFRPLLP